MKPGQAINIPFSVALILSQSRSISVYLLLLSKVPPLKKASKSETRPANCKFMSMLYLNQQLSAGFSITIYGLL